MFTKIHYAFYNMLFELYGRLAKRYSRKMKEDEAHRRYWERKLRICLDDRDDILDIMFTLKGLS